MCSGPRCHGWPPTMAVPPSRSATTRLAWPRSARTRAHRPVRIPLWDGRAGARLAAVCVANFAVIRLD